MKVILLLIFFFTALTISHSQEICGNNIDDDNDNLVDCYDDDCASNVDCEASSCFINTGISSDCPPGIFTPNPDFGLSLKWESTERVHSASLLVVGDIDNDCTPEIVVKNFEDEEIYIFDGALGTLESSIPVDIYRLNQNLAIGDTDQDDLGEIFIVTDDLELRSYENDGTLKWTTPANVIPSDFNAPHLADFNQDGISEIYIENQIYNSITGALIGEAGAGFNDGFGYGFAADVLPDGFCPDCAGLELICGDEVFSVNIATGTVAVASGLPPGIGADGRTSVADMDNDGALDVVVVSSNTTTGAFVFVWNPRTGALLPTTGSNPFQLRTDLSTPNGSNGGGRANISDYDNDGFLEIGLAGLHVFAVIDDDMTELWSTGNVYDESSQTGSTVFDFEGDGIPEAVYRDEDTLYIFNGIDGVVKDKIPCGSTSWTENPTIADVDNDGEADILCACSARVSVFTSNTNTWVSTRNVWNQHGYTPTVINDDLSIPTQQQNQALVASENIFLSQSINLNENGTPLLGIDVNLGQDIELCSPPIIDLDSRISDPSLFSIEWYKDGAITSSQELITVNEPGEYIVVIDGPGTCDATDTIEISTKDATPENAVFCTDGSSTLGITNTSGTCPFQWYDAPTDGTLLATGCSFNTPTLSSTTTYYVQDTSNQSYTVGYSPTDLTLSTAWFGNSEHRMTFDVLTSITIDSLTILYDQPGWCGGATSSTGVIDVLISGNGINQTVPIEVNCGGGQDIVTAYIGVELPIGNNYTMRFTGTGTQVYHAPNGADYVNDLTYSFIDITGNATGDLDDYGGFFDWVVRTGSGCDRTPVTAEKLCLSTCLVDAQVNATELSICIDSTTTIDGFSSTGSGSLSFEWNDSSTDTTAIVSSAGTYTLTVSNSDGGTICTSTASITISEYPATMLAITRDTVCPSFNGTIQVTQDTFSNYLWSDLSNQPYLSNTAGTYTLTVTAANGCNSFAEGEIFQTNAPNTETIDSISICTNDTININTLEFSDLNNTNPTPTYYESDLTTIIVNGNVFTSGNIYMINENLNGCQDTSSIHIALIDLPTVNLEVDNTACGIGEQINISLSGTANALVTFEYNSVMQSVTLDNDGNYNLSVTASAVGETELDLIEIFDPATNCRRQYCE